MVGLWSPDPPPEPDNLEENNPGYVVLFAASDEEQSDEGYEGYEPLSDTGDGSDDGNDSDNYASNYIDNEEEHDQTFNASASDGDMQDRVRPVDTQRSCSSGRECCKHFVPVSLEGNVEETASSSTTWNSQEIPSAEQAISSSSRLEMGERQVADVMAAMANITLPPSAVPQWATVVPEDEWIQHILERVQLLQNKNLNGNQF